MNTSLKVVLGITGLIAVPVVAGVYSTFRLRTEPLVISVTP